VRVRNLELHSTIFFAGLLWALGCGQCGEPPIDLPDGGQPDEVDAGSRDAGTFDAGTFDAGTFDAGTFDAGTFDAGTFDAGTFDSGTIDSGTIDSGIVDDGGAIDGGEADAGAPDAGCGCTTGWCLGDGGCGECRTGADCPVDRPFCDPASTCQECASAPVDTCGGGRYCEQGHCLTGCRDAQMCPSGICLASHDCFNCQLDSECSEGKLCGTGRCTPPCTQGSCADGLSCCSGRCVDPTRDALHCGSCDHPCALGAFCGRSECRPALASNVCQEPVVRVIFDDMPIDDAAGLAMGTALASSCSPAMTLLTAGQRDAGILDVTTGEPLQTGELLVMGGGAFYQRAIAWLEANSLAPVVESSTATELRYSQADGGMICSRAFSSISATHDLAIIELAVAPSGAIVFNAAGFEAAGTTAAAWYVVNELVPNLTSYAQGWYVIEWQDNAMAGQVGQPDALDTWTPIASGS
jgi:hypothetical protein